MSLSWSASSVLGSQCDGLSDVDAVGPSDLSAESAAAMTPVAASPAVRLLWRRRCALRGGISFGGMVWCDRWRGGDGGGVACVALVSVVLGAEVESVVC